MFLTVILFLQSLQLVRLGAFRLTFTGTTFTLFKLSLLTEIFFRLFSLYFEIWFSIYHYCHCSSGFQHVLQIYFIAGQLLDNQGSVSGRYMYLKKAFQDEVSCMEVQGFFRVEIHSIFIYLTLQNISFYRREVHGRFRNRTECTMEMPFFNSTFSVLCIALNNHMFDRCPIGSMTYM